jgi:hypothetical protein
MSQAVAGVCLLAFAAACAYWRAFSHYAAYDDEGYVLQTIRSYLEGQRLFEDVFTQYGPAFFVLESLIHQTLGAPLTHDVERFATVGIWVAASACSAAIVLRLTQSSIAAVLTLVGVFLHLTPLVFEPGHPQGWLVLTIALVTLIAAWARADALSAVQMTTAAVLTAIALLVKVNVGAYLALGFALPVLLASRLPRSRVTSVLLAAVATLACVLPLVVTRSHLRGWALNYALVTCFSLAATILVIAPAGRQSLPVGIILRYTLTTAVACALLLLPALVRGTSVWSLLNGIILRPSYFADLFTIPLMVPTASLLPASVSLAASVAFVVYQRFRPALPSTTVAVAKLLVGAIGLRLYWTGYIGLLSYFTPLLWIVAVPSKDDSSRGETLGRSVLALVAVFQSLQAYPVAGSQVAFASFLMIPVVFVCLYDGVAILARRFAAARGVLSWAFQISMVVAGLLLYSRVANPRVWRAAHAAGYELRLRGAEHLRLPAPDVARYHWLSGAVGENCGALLTLPGLYSLNAWAGVPPVNGMNATAWMTLLSPTEQASVWSAIDGADRACAVYNPTIAAVWIGQTSPETLSAYREMVARFQPIAEADGYRLLMRKADVAPADVFMPLVAGRQAFARRRSPLPIVATLAVGHVKSTLRTWVKSSGTGVIVGCQTEAHAGIHSWKWLPMIYLGNTGRLYGQHWTASLQGHGTGRALNDGNWHHVALVRDENDQRLYVDAELVGESRSTIETAGLQLCQVGTGATSLWPDAPRGWMPFDGEVEGLGVSLRAWSAREVGDDWRRTRPVE